MTSAELALDRARTVADAVLYEGYLLYPYRATSGKNQSRWQFGVLGPPGAAQAGSGEDPALASELLVRGDETAELTVQLRFLHLQRRTALRVAADGAASHVDELVVGDQRWLTWDEAVECEPDPAVWTLAHLADGGRVQELVISAGEDLQDVPGNDGALAGRLVRTRRALRAALHADAVRVDGAYRVSLRIENTTAGVATDPGSAIAASLIGAHLLATIGGGAFVSMTDPPPDLTAAAAGCAHHRCWPVLAGDDGDTSMMLVSPIILYDHPQIAEQSQGSLFDSTEIDEILTLRVMTMTDEEKATARATDAKAAEIIDRCDAMSPQDMQSLHGVLRDPHGGRSDDPFAGFGDDAFLAGPPDAFGNDLSGTFGFDGEVPWWDPAVDGSVDPATDSVTVRGVVIGAGSIVRIKPNRRADAQDIFFADKLARVTAVHTDVDGDTHVAVVILDDPAAEMHDWYGRYLHFAPDELEPQDPQPVDPPAGDDNRQESRS